MWPLQSRFCRETDAFEHVGNELLGAQSQVSRNKTLAATGYQGVGASPQHAWSPNATVFDCSRNVPRHEKTVADAEKRSLK